MRHVPLLAVLSLAGLACRADKAETGEGAHEHDPGRPDSDADTGAGGSGSGGGPGGDGSGDLIDPSDWPAVEADAEACYLGPDRDDTVCLPTVEWSEEWGSAYAYPPPLDDDPQYSAPARYIDLEAATADPGLDLAPNFALDELMQAYKGRFGLFQDHTVASLQAMRDTIGGPVYVNSGYRNVDYNDGVGGATWSRHQYGDAVDIRSDDASLEELARICTDLGAGFTSVYETHVHCDWRRTALDTAFYDVESTGEAASDLPSARIGWTSDGRLQPELSGFDEGVPRMRWTALDAHGAVLVVETGRSFSPPEAAHRVEVDIGGHLVRRVSLEAHAR